MPVPTEPPRVGPARADELEQLLDLAATSRAAHAAYEPRFWNPAPDARDRHRPFLAGLLADADALVVAARDADGRVRGFGVGRLVAAPPVYDPGGGTCVVDDLAVADPAEWARTGPALLAAVRAWAAGRGAAQLVVVAAHLDGAKRAVLSDAGLGVASEWWVGPVGGATPGPG